MANQPTQARFAVADRAPVELPHPVRMRVLGAVMIGVFLAALDQTVVGTALPRIVSDLGGNDLYTWAFTAYLLTSTISGPLYGKLSDLFGRRPIMLFGIGVFMIGSLLAGLSQEMWQLVAARGIQGLGAGALFPIALAVIADLFAPSERGRYQGLFGAVFGLSVLIGPAIGGLITDTIGWPFVFFFNLPVGAFVFFVVSRYLPLYHLAGDKPRIDYLGAALFTAALVPILVGLTNKQRADWNDPVVGGLILLGAVILIAFVFVESRAREPIVPLDLFRNRSFTVSVAAFFLAMFGFFATVVFLPRWFQVVGGSSATISGYQMLPAARRPDLQRGDGRPDRQPDRALSAPVVRRARGDGPRAVHAQQPPRRHAHPGPVGLDVRDGRRRRSDVRGVHDRRPEQRPGRADRHRDQQPDLLPVGRRDGRPGSHRHDLRVVAGGSAAGPDGRRRRPAGGRRCAGRLRWRTGRGDRRR